MNMCGRVEGGGGGVESTTMHPKLAAHALAALLHAIYPEQRCPSPIRTVATRLLTEKQLSLPDKASLQPHPAARLRLLLRTQFTLHITRTCTLQPLFFRVRGRALYAY